MGKKEILHCNRFLLTTFNKIGVYKFLKDLFISVVLNFVKTREFAVKTPKKNIVNMLILEEKLFMSILNILKSTWTCCLNVLIIFLLTQIKCLFDEGNLCNDP